MLYLRKFIIQNKFQSIWIILLLDLTIVYLSLTLSILLENKVDTMFNSTNNILFFCCNSILVFLIMRTHTHIIRYSNTKDMLRIFLAVLINNLLFMIICNFLFVPHMQAGLTRFGDILLTNLFISSFLLMGMRISIKKAFSFFQEPNEFNEKENVLIYGSAMPSILIKKTIEGQKNLNIHVQGFIDTGADKIYKSMEQKHVFPIREIDRLRKRFNIKTMLITSEELNIDGKKSAIEKCIELGIKIITVPPSNQWFNGKPNISQFKDLKIEDLLQRQPIDLCKDHILKEVSGKRILVTGAAGSIGSEIVRQIMLYDPEYIIICDQAETPLHNIQLEFEDIKQAGKTKIFIADIKNLDRIRTLFTMYKPQIVFHAAAYKHVPMMENNPTEAVQTNICGTKNIADISIEFGVEKFIMISTDKAVRPTNVMGASKRIAEMYIQSLSNKLFNKKLLHALDGNELGCKTKFITTRFGNVLGSNGSVIPRFKAQIEKGGPVTVTHPDITRYFMTIPEAVQLVLEAFVMGKGSEIFLFDMGQPVKIADLATNMIKLAGFVPEAEIKIVYTGLRPGEKLYEELLNSGEQTIPTYNKNIKISKIVTCSNSSINNLIEELFKLCSFSNSEELIVLKMKNILPDFISNNSKYEKLDRRHAII